MKKLAPYLSFGGNCEQALNFYKECFGGEFTLTRYGENPMPAPDDFKQKILHASFKSESIVFYASDHTPEHQIKNGDNITLSLEFADTVEQEKIFKLLSSGGVVTMPLQDQFWDAKFGMLTDRFGFIWLLNCEKSIK
jgi:PhnB protein